MDRDPVIVENLKIEKWELFLIHVNIFVHNNSKVKILLFMH
jgi:hypothetical protein